MELWFALLGLTIKAICIACIHGENIIPTYAFGAKKGCWEGHLVLPITWGLENKNAWDLQP